LWLLLSIGLSLLSHPQSVIRNPKWARREHFKKGKEEKNDPEKRRIGFLFFFLEGRLRFPPFYPTLICRFALNVRWLTAS